MNSPPWPQDDEEDEEDEFEDEDFEDEDFERMTITSFTRGQRPGRRREVGTGAGGSQWRRYFMTGDFLDRLNRDA